MKRRKRERERKRGEGEEGHFIIPGNTETSSTIGLSTALLIQLCLLGFIFETDPK